LACRTIEQFHAASCPYAVSMHYCVIRVEVGAVYIEMIVMNYFIDPANEITNMFPIVTQISFLHSSFIFIKAYQDQTK